VIGTALTALAVLAGPAIAQTVPAKPPDVIRAAFACEGGRAIDAEFDNAPKPLVRLGLSDGRAMALPQALSASGARYANADESIVFWNKGDTAFLEEGGKTTFAGCVVKR